MNCFGLEFTFNKLKRIKFYKKLSELGIKRTTHKPEHHNSYFVITPEHKCIIVPYWKFDTFMFGNEHIVYEARTEKEFFNLIKQYFNL